MTDEERLQQLEDEQLLERLEKEQAAGRSQDIYVGRPALSLGKVIEGGEKLARGTARAGVQAATAASVPQRTLLAKMLGASPQEIQQIQEPLWATLGLEESNLEYPSTSELVSKYGPKSPRGNVVLYPGGPEMSPFVQEAASLGAETIPDPFWGLGLRGVAFGARKALPELASSIAKRAAAKETPAQLAARLRALNPEEAVKEATWLGSPVEKMRRGIVNWAEQNQKLPAPVAAELQAASEPKGVATRILEFAQAPGRTAATPAGVERIAQAIQDPLSGLVNKLGQQIEAAIIPATVLREAAKSAPAYVPHTQAAQFVKDFYRKNNIRGDFEGQFNRLVAVKGRALDEAKKVEDRLFASLPPEQAAKMNALARENMRKTAIQRGQSYLAQEQLKMQTNPNYAQDVASDFAMARNQLAEMTRNLDNPLLSGFQEAISAKKTAQSLATRAYGRAGPKQSDFLAQFNREIGTGAREAVESTIDTIGAEAPVLAKDLGKKLKALNRDASTAISLEDAAGKAAVGEKPQALIGAADILAGSAAALTNIALPGSAAGNIATGLAIGQRALRAAKTPEIRSLTGPALQKASKVLPVGRISGGAAAQYGRKSPGVADKKPPKVIEDFKEMFPDDEEGQ